MFRGKTSNPLFNRGPDPDPLSDALREVSAFGRTWLNPVFVHRGIHLSRGNDHSLPIRGNLQRSELLDLSRLQYDGSNVKAQISLGLNGNQLRSVVLPRHMFEGARQRSPGGVRHCCPKPSVAKGTMDTQEMPTHAANHRIKNRRCDLRNNRPVFANRILQWI